MDITMCDNELCPIKAKCLRYRAVPDGWQSYSRFIYENNKCEDFIEYREKIKEVK